MRLFIAMSFPEAVLRPVNERAIRVKPKLPPAAWVRPESQHLTFAFLGEQDESLVDKLGPLVEKSVGAVKRFEGTIADCGFFPNPRHARVGWVGVRPENAFNALAKAVRDAVQAAGVTLDRAEFRAHLTLMRIRNPWPPACVETFNSALRDFVSAPFPVERITLFSSRLDPNGAVHTPLRDFALSA
ncbi:MAG TPA: RNA 2',3'-cyclic phosphodiesterase [Thermoanaerobaculia bacterium]|nr:RNA 2',3'-cyclic phosphodiesterase [Thermoanaerobaculia bacterium]